MRAQLESESLMGVATFGKRPLLTDPTQLDEWRPDVAIVGAPWDDNTTHRPGARFGPRALRASTYVNGSYHLDLQVEISDHLEVVDYGDALVANGLWEVSRAAIHDRVAEVASRGIIPVVIGGDHSITWPSATAVAEHHGFRQHRDHPLRRAR
jgi:agmatinase